VLVPTPAIRNLIREGKTHQIYSAIQTSGAQGMQTMDANLAQLVRAGKITRQLAERRASVPEELKRLLGGAGGSGSSTSNGASGARNGKRAGKKAAKADKKRGKRAAKKVTA
jgi:twitching motility protein PilT